jgi:hypothetical protein
MRYSVVMRICAFSISAHLAVVPPISRAMMWFSPSRRPSAAAPSTPLAGPDSTMAIGFSTAPATVSTPPLDCMI